MVKPTHQPTHTPTHPRTLRSLTKLPHNRSLAPIASHTSPLASLSRLTAILYILTPNIPLPFPLIGPTYN